MADYWQTRSWIPNADHYTYSWINQGYLIKAKKSDSSHNYNWICLCLLVNWRGGNIDLGWGPGKLSNHQLTTDVISRKVWTWELHIPKTKFCLILFKTLCNSWVVLASKASSKPFMQAKFFITIVYANNANHNMKPIIIKFW